MRRRSSTTLPGIFFFTAIIFVIFYAPAMAQEEGATKLYYENDGPLEVRGVEIFDNIVYIPVLLNSSHPFTFVLDTGAGQHSVLDETEASTLGLKVTPYGEGGGAGEEIVRFGLTSPLSLSIPGLEMEALPLVTLPLHRLDPHWGKRKDGMIGGDILSRLITIIDYEKSRVVFRDAAAGPYKGPGEMIPVTMEGNFILLDAEVLLFGKEEPIEGSFLVDTGVRLSVFNSPFAAKHGLAEQSPGTLAGPMGYGIGGVASGIAGRVKGVRIGNDLIEEPVVSFSTDTSGFLADSTFAGIIGADFLSRFTVVFDYSRSTMYLEKNDSFNDSFEFDMCGIRFMMEGDNFDRAKAFAVYRGSPADEAGIRAGDTVVSIDGRDPGSIGWEGLREYLSRDGREVHFVIERGGATHKIVLKLKKMV